MNTKHVDAKQYNLQNMNDSQQHLQNSQFIIPLHLCDMMWLVVLMFFFPRIVPNILQITSFVLLWSSVFALTQLPWSPWLVSGRQTRHSAITGDLKRDGAPTCQFSAESWEDAQEVGWKATWKLLWLWIWSKAKPGRGQDWKRKPKDQTTRTGRNHPFFQTYGNQYLYIHIRHMSILRAFRLSLQIIHHRIAGKIKLLHATVSAPAAAANFKHSWPNCNNKPYNYIDKTCLCHLAREFF